MGHVRSALTSFINYCLASADFFSLVSSVSWSVPLREPCSKSVSSSCSPLSEDDFYMFIMTCASYEFLNYRSLWKYVIWGLHLFNSMHPPILVLHPSSLYLIDHSTSQSSRGFYQDVADSFCPSSIHARWVSNDTLFFSIFLSDSFSTWLAHSQLCENANLICRAPVFLSLWSPLVIVNLVWFSQSIPLTVVYSTGVLVFS